MSESEIKERFRCNRYKFVPILKTLYGITLSEDVCNEVVQSSKSNGIESLAGSLYKYVKINVSKKWTDNDSKMLLDISEYERVYTLNYTEFWDNKEEYIYLHGKIDLSNLGSGQNILLSSIERNYLQEYREVIDIFGLSPYGDDSLIDVINRMKSVTVYIQYEN